MKTFIRFSVIILLCALVAFFITDCSAGKTTFEKGIVTDRQYKAAWTSTYVSFDDDHIAHVHTVYHPEEWHVFCEADCEEFDIESSHQRYASVTNGQPVFVRFREGRW